MDALLSDLRYAFRTLRKSPAFTIIAVVCLGVGIATNTSIFSCFNAMVLRPLPFPDPDQLMYLSDTSVRLNGTNNVSFLTYKDWQAQTRSFASIAASTGRSMAITEGDEPERLFANLISANLFPTIGVAPQIGRGFREDEDRAGAPGVVLISDAVWKRRYAGDSAVLNKVVSINNQPYTIVGVMPPRFQFPNDAEMWVPIAPFYDKSTRDNRGLQVWARLAPAATADAANRELASVSKRLNEQYDPTSEWFGHATPLKNQFVEREANQMVTTMFGAVLLVLLIACANVANLLLTRSASRQREIAIRAAIGAGRGRIVRQLLAESLLLAVMAATLALPLTWIGLKLIDRGIPAENPLPWYYHWGLDAPTLIYTLVIAAVTSVVFGLAPALQVSRGRVYDALKEGGGRSNMGSAKKNKLRSALVIAEVALSLILLVGASLFARTFLALQHVDVGYDTSKMLTMRVYLPGTRYDSVAAIHARVRDVLDRVSAIPNVEAATVSNSAPFGSCCSGSGILIDGQRVERGREPIVDWVASEGKWMNTFGIAIAQGRDFTDLEVQSSSPSVALVDQRMADKFWPKGAIGQRFRLTYDSTRSFEIVGVVPGVQLHSLDNTNTPRPVAYIPYMHLPARNNALMIRVRSGNPLIVAPAVRKAIRDADPTMPVFDLRTTDAAKQLSYWQYGLFYKMFGTFGAIALLLAGIGVYGVISYGVSQRTQEIGVRVALGARNRDVFGMVLREASWLAGLGVLIGVAGAFGVTRVLSSFLIGVSPTDPASFIGVAAFLTAVALFASWIPARRAMSVDPLVALRND